MFEEKESPNWKWDRHWEGIFDLSTFGISDVNKPNAIENLEITDYEWNMLYILSRRELAEKGEEIIVYYSPYGAAFFDFSFNFKYSLVTPKN